MFFKPRRELYYHFYNLGSSWEKVLEKTHIIYRHLLAFSLWQHKPFILYFISRTDRKADQGSCLCAVRNKLFK